MRGVDVGMRLMAAVRTGGVVPLADSPPSAPGTGPAGVGRVDVRHGYAAHLGFLLDCGPDFPPLPEIKAAAQSLAANPPRVGLGDVPHVFEDEYGVGGNSRHESRRCLPGDGPGSAALPAAAPFEHTTDTLRVSLRPAVRAASVRWSRALFFRARRFFTLTAFPETKNVRPSGSTATTVLVSFRSMPYAPLYQMVFGQK